MAGSCNGYFKQGEYIKVTEGDQWGDEDNTRNDNDAPHNKLLTTCANAVGVPTTHLATRRTDCPGSTTS